MLSACQAVGDWLVVDKTQIKFISDLQQHENISQLRPDLQTTNLAFYPGDLAVSKVWLIYPFMITTLGLFVKLHCSHLMMLAGLTVLSSAWRILAAAEHAVTPAIYRGEEDWGEVRWEVETVV